MWFKAIVYFCFLHQVVRNSLLPGILKTLMCNRDMSIPLKLFEIQDVVYMDQNSGIFKHCIAVLYFIFIKFMTCISRLSLNVKAQILNVNFNGKKSLNC